MRSAIPRGTGLADRGHLDDLFSGQDVRVLGGFPVQGG
jgi:hypothetical protein